VVATPGLLQHVQGWLTYVGFDQLNSTRWRAYIDDETDERLREMVESVKRHFTIRSSRKDMVMVGKDSDLELHFDLGEQFLICNVKSNSYSSLGVRPLLFPSIALYRLHVKASMMVTGSADGIVKTLIEEQPFGTGIVRRKERWEMLGSPPMDMDVCYSLDGKFIGSPDDAKFFAERGIVPEAKPGLDVCSIGFCEKEQKWYGWSHRAVFGFGIGDDYYHPETMWNGAGSFAPKKSICTMEEAKESAIHFSDDVS
jgi:hypothetical protein